MSRSHSVTTCCRCIGDSGVSALPVHLEALLRLPPHLPRDLIEERVQRVARESLPPRDARAVGFLPTPRSTSLAPSPLCIVEAQVSSCITQLWFQTLRSYKNQEVSLMVKNLLSVLGEIVGQ
eukprot:5823229-Amphidinium_carterae.1